MGPQHVRVERLSVCVILSQFRAKRVVGHRRKLLEDGVDGVPDGKPTWHGVDKRRKAATVQHDS